MELIDKAAIEIADWTLEEALRCGADNARVELNQIDMLTVQTENDALASLQQSRSRSLIVYLYVNQRYGTISTSLTQRDAVSQLLRTGIASTRLLTADPDYTLPDPKRYYRAASLEENARQQLALGNWRHLDDSQATQQALSIYPSIPADSRMLAVSSQLGHRRGYGYSCDSQGFRGISAGTYTYAFCNVSVEGTDGSRPSDGFMVHGLDYAQLVEQLPLLGTRSLRNALDKIDARQLPAGTYTVAVEPCCLMKLIDPLVDAMMGGSLYQHRSFLEGRMGEQIAAPCLTLSNQPQRQDAFGANLFDTTVKTGPYKLIEDGRLATWIIGTYYAHKLKCEPTDANTSVLCIEPGQRSRQEIFDTTPQLLLITGFLGGNHNEVTGDFSFGIEGQLYRHGQRVHGVSGMNLTGNLLTLWQNLSELSAQQEKLPEGYLPMPVFEQVNLV